MNYVLFSHSTNSQQTNVLITFAFPFTTIDFFLELTDNQRQCVLIYQLDAVGVLAKGEHRHRVPGSLACPRGCAGSLGLGLFQICARHAFSIAAFGIARSAGTFEPNQCGTEGASWNCRRTLCYLSGAAASRREDQDSYVFAHLPQNLLGNNARIRGQR